MKIRNRRPGSIRTPACSPRSSIFAATRRRKPIAIGFVPACFISSFSASMFWSWPPEFPMPPRLRPNIKVPTMQASECVVCHKTARSGGRTLPGLLAIRRGLRKAQRGLVQGYVRRRLRRGRSAGPGALAIPSMARRADRKRSAFRGRDGGACLLHPDWPQSPEASERFGGLRSSPPNGGAYQEQRKQIESIAVRFSQNGFNLKNVFKDWVLTDFYRANGLAAAASDPARQAELDDVGLVRMLAPEQIERKVTAIFGRLGAEWTNSSPCCTAASTPRK